MKRKILLFLKERGVNVLFDIKQSLSNADHTRITFEKYIPKNTYQVFIINVMIKEPKSNTGSINYIEIF